MEIPAYKEYETLLKLINKAGQTKFTELINSISNKVIRSIIEIAYNLLKGNIPINEKDIIRLRKYKKQLKLLISKRTSIKKKRKLLKENIKLVKYMFKIMFR